MFLSIKMCKKIAIIPFLFVTAFLSSCSESEKVEEFRIKESCIGNVCSLTLIDLSINRSRNIIGKITDHTLSSDTVGLESPTNIKWIIEGAYKLPTSQQMTNLGLSACVADCKLTDANPTGVIFNNFGQQMVNVKGPVFDVNKNQRNIDITHHFETSVAGELPPIVVNHTGMDYTFTINLDDLGLLDDNSAHKWTIMKGDELIKTSAEQGTSFNFDVDIAGGGDYTILYEFINENHLSNPLTQTLNINVVDEFQDLVNTMQAERIEGTNTIIASFNNKTLFDNFKLKHPSATYTWSIDSSTSIQTSHGPVRWPDLIWDKPHTVTVLVADAKSSADSTYTIVIGGIPQNKLDDIAGTMIVELKGFKTLYARVDADLAALAPSLKYEWSVTGSHGAVIIDTPNGDSKEVRISGLKIDTKYNVELTITNPNTSEEGEASETETTSKAPTVSIVATKKTDERF
ncbi:MAG: hypothetical protein ACI9BN_001197, partial [Francisella sp.]